MHNCSMASLGCVQVSLNTNAVPKQPFSLQFTMWEHFLMAPNLTRAGIGMHLFPLLLEKVWKLG